MVLTDGKRTVSIRMAEWTGNGWSPDFSYDFFNGIDKVRDVGYCIEQAIDWRDCRGDYSYDAANPSDRIVEVEEL